MNLDIFKLTRTIILVGLIFCVIVLINRFELQAQNTRVVNSINVEISSFAEPLSDVEYWQYDPKGNLIKYDMFQNSGNGYVIRNFQLGKSLDERDGCVVVEQDRRKGACEDGLYRFDLKSTDAPGNASEISTTYIERDTVKPFEPTISNPYICGVNICIKAKGESGSKFMVNGLDSGILSQSEQEFVILWNWKYSVKYEFEIWAMDIAGNESKKVTRSFVQIPGIGSGGDGSTLGLQDYANAEADIYIDENGYPTITAFRHVHPPILFSSSTEFGTNNVTINGFSINNGFVYQVKGNITSKRKFHTNEELMEACQVGNILDFEEMDCIANLLLSDGENAERERIANECSILRIINILLYRSCFEQKINEKKYYYSKAQIQFPFKIDRSIVNFYKDSNYFAQMENNSTNGNWSEKFLHTDNTRKLDEGNKVKAKTKLFATMQFEYNGTSYSVQFGNDGWESGFSNEIVINPAPNLFDIAIHPLSDESCLGFAYSRGFEGHLKFGLHDGIDWAKENGCTVKSAAPGIVRESGFDGHTGQGNYLYIDHLNGWYTVYLHGEALPYVKSGDRVDFGTPIMYMGNTGNSFGTHLHFSLWNGYPWNYKSYPVDPALHFNFLKNE